MSSRPRQKPRPKGSTALFYIAHTLFDRSGNLSSIGDREGPFPLPHGPGDELHRGPSGRDPRDPSTGRAKRSDGNATDLWPGSGLEAEPQAGLKVRTRDFR